MSMRRLYTLPLSAHADPGKFLCRCVRESWLFDPTQDMGQREVVKASWSEKLALCALIFKESRWFNPTRRHIWDNSTRTAFVGTQLTPARLGPRKNAVQGEDKELGGLSSWSAQLGRSLLICMEGLSGESGGSNPSEDMLRRVGITRLLVKVWVLGKPGSKPGSMTGGIAGGQAEFKSIKLHLLQTYRPP
ncbi:hypothetical protein B0H17DRAFT_1144886 [Mycena rosella]|uniref:Uncharacterized protein n=1 Tax=Mycena rosella TaxID=1033263 RepID=A0AAD7G678_MYCRO|nr:hypothetical protein B0H17DRAFT_1144886 [Mycena rosella]